MMISYVYLSYKDARMIPWLFLLPLLVVLTPKYAL